MAKLHLDIAEGDCVRVGDAIITMERKQGKKARFMINADKSVAVELIKNSSKSEEIKTTIPRMSATDIKGTNSWQEQSLG